MTALTIRRTAHLLAASLLTAALVVAVAADGSGASPTGCRGLSPASAVDCPPSAFAP